MKKFIKKNYNKFIKKNLSPQYKKKISVHSINMPNISQNNEIEHINKEMQLIAR